jgi:hypothetical protein
VELFLVDMETEALSKRTYEPTDYLEVDYKEKFFGKKVNQFIYNSTRDVSLKFRTDLLFSNRGFFLYFQVARKLEEIDMEEEIVTEAVTTTPTTTTTTTSSTSESLVSTLMTEADDSNGEGRSSKIFMVNNDRVFNSKLKASENDVDSRSLYFNGNNFMILMAAVVFLSLVVIFLVFASK